MNAREFVRPRNVVESRTLLTVALMSALSWGCDARGQAAPSFERGSLKATDPLLAPDLSDATLWNQGPWDVYTLDRTEEDWAVLVTDLHLQYHVVNIPLEALPDTTREGDGLLVRVFPRKPLADLPDSGRRSYLTVLDEQGDRVRCRLHGRIVALPREMFQTEVSRGAVLVLHVRGMDNRFRRDRLLVARAGLRSIRGNSVEIDLSHPRHLEALISGTHPPVGHSKTRIETTSAMVRNAGRNE